MPDEKTETTKAKPEETDAPKVGDAQAPGPITESHESGSWEQTKAAEKDAEKK